MLYTKLLENYKDNPEKYCKEIQEAEQKMVEMGFMDLDQINKENEKARMQIVDLSNEKYSSMYDAVTEGIKQLELFYETQLESFK
jgi:uncharacterized protein related to proFAR isomerase